MNTNYRFGEVLPLCSQVDYSEERPSFQRIFETNNGGIALLALKKDQRLDTHTAPFEVMVSVCEGEIEFKMIDQIHRLKAGEFLLMGADVEHSVKALADAKILLVKIKN